MHVAPALFAVLLSASALAMADPLAPSTWNVREIDRSPVLLDSGVTVQFPAPGQLAGNTGVNVFHGSYKISGSTISIGPIATTLRAGPDNLMEQESRFLQVLSAITDQQVEADTLILTGPKGKLVATRSIKPDKP